MADMTVPSSGSGKQDQALPSSKLPREMGFFAVLVFSVACTSLSFSGQLLFSTALGIWPGSNLVVVLSLAILFCMFLAYTYAVIGSVAPRPGADYVVASRTLSAPLAFASSWTMVIFSALIAGSFIAVIPQSTLPMFFHLFGMIGASGPAWNDLAISVSTPENTVLIGTVVVVLTFLLLITPPRVILRTLQIGFGLGILTWGIIFYQLISAPANSFQVAWNRAMGEGSYLNHLVQANNLGMSFSVNSNTMILISIIMGFWVFYGYLIPTFFAGEVKRPERNLISGSITSLLLTGGIFIGVSLLLLRLVPIEWLSAESFLYQSKLFQGLAMPWIPFYAAILQPNLVLTGIVFIGWLYTLINLVQAYFYYCSRIILAWVDEGVFPEVMGTIHPVMRSPLIAVLMVAIITELGLVGAALYNAVTAQVSIIFFLVCAQILPVLSVTLLPFIKRDWFKSSSRFVRLKIGPLPVITLVGGISLVYLIAALVVCVMDPILGGVGMPFITTFLVVFLSGLVWYYGHKLVMARQANENAAAVHPAGD